MPLNLSIEIRSMTMQRLKAIWLASVLILTFSRFTSADDWPQWLGPKRDSVWRETGIIDKFPEGGPKVVWRKPVAGGYSGPAVAEGRVYVPDFVTSVDTRAVSSPQERPAIDGQERVLCLDAKTGEQLWVHKYACKYGIAYPAGPRC